MRRLLFDIETDGLLPEMTTIHSLVIMDVDTEELISLHGGEIPMGLKLLQSADVLVGHNIICFDIPGVKKIHPWFDYKGQVFDTLVASRLTWLQMKGNDFQFRRKCPDFPGNLIGRHSLEAWGWRLGFPKGDYKKDMEARGLDPWAQWSPEMQAYCEQDVKLNLALLKLIEAKKRPAAPFQLEFDFQELIFQQEQHGIRFNTPAAVKLYNELAGLREGLTNELQAVFPPVVTQMKQVEYYTLNGPQHRPIKCKTKGAANKRRKQEGWAPKECSITPGPRRTKETPFNPASDKQIAERLTEKYGWKPTVFTDGGDPSITEETLNAMTYEEAPLLLKYAVVKKTISMLAEGKQAWLKHEKNGRIYGRVNTLGTVTTRCSHSNPNLAQVPAVLMGKDGKPLLGYEGKWGWECRSLFMADEGWKIVGADASGLELRNLGHYMARYDDGAYVKVILEGDIHTTNQEAAGLSTRAKAKRFIYAYLYGAGDALIGALVLEDTEPDASEKRQKQVGRQVKRRFLKKTPALKRLREDIAAVVEKKGYLRGIDKRILPVRHAHAALNTLLQSCGAILVKYATVIAIKELLKRGYKFGEDFEQVLHVHDEVQITCRPEITDEVGQVVVDAIKKTGDHYEFRCPLDGEYKVGDTWAETH